MNLETIKNANTVESHQTALTESCSWMADLTDFERNEIIKQIKSMNVGGKGRSVRPDFYNKEKPVSTGKRGRPALSAEEKLERAKAKFEAEQAKILADNEEQGVQVG